MPMTDPAYFTAFKNFAFSRTPSGVLTLRFHTEGGPATFTGQMHTDFPRALYEIGDDRDNRVLVLTGTGDRFMTGIDGPSLDDPAKPAVWDKTTAEGRRIMQRLAGLEMPIVAAVNGPAAVHSEYVLLADIVIAADTTVFSDFPHLTFGIVSGDGIYLAWEETTSGPAENGVHDMIGTGPIGQTVIRRARAAVLIVAAVERAGE
jgi:enoyl-CoA hydratase/carnithine racemase